jgi:hypothetical protein
MEDRPPIDEKFQQVNLSWREGELAEWAQKVSA